MPQPNVFRGVLKIEEWRERGAYTVSRVNISDRAQNYRNLNPVRDEEIRGLEVVFLPEDEDQDRTTAKKPRQEGS